MPRKNEATATRVFIDPVVLERIEATRPPAISRTGWVNYLLQLGNFAVLRQGNINQRPDA